jgi:hypothetical protein
VRPWFPRLSDDVVNVAVPAAIIPVPSAVFPSMNVTLPLGEGLPPGLTVAVSVTTWPEFAGLGVAVRVAELVCWIPRVTAGDMLPRKFASPVYVTVMECEPALSEEVVSVACPALNVPVPMLADTS